MIDANELQVERVSVDVEVGTRLLVTTAEAIGGVVFALDSVRSMLKGDASRGLATGIVALGLCFAAKEQLHSAADMIERYGLLSRD